MGKLSSVAQRIADAKKDLDAQADALATKLDALSQKAPQAFANAHSIVDTHQADLDVMDSELRQLSNLPSS